MDRIACKIEVYSITDSSSYKHDGFISESVEGLVVSFDDDGENYTYVGTQVGDGHWNLRDRDREYKDTANLHKTPESRIYIGYYQNEYGSGFWKVFI